MTERSRGGGWVLGQVVLVAGTPTGVYPDPGPIEILRGNAIPLFAAADAALAKSGTTTLEAALAALRYLHGQGMVHLQTSNQSPSACHCGTFAIAGFLACGC